MAENRVPEDVKYIVTIVGEREWVDYRVAFND